jgi:outer membrane protein
MRITQFIIIFLFLSNIMLQAQDKLILGVSEAREHALMYNRNIKNTGLAIDKSQERLWEAVSAGLPQVNASADYSNAMGAQISIQFDENIPATQIPIKPTSNFNLQVGQLIFNGNYIVGIQLARLARTLSEKNLKKTEQEVVSQVTESYYLTLLSEESLKILSTNTENLKDVFRKTEPLVKVGMLEKLELDQLQVQVNSLSNAVRSAERQYEMAKNMLRLQLGVTSETELELTESLSDLIEKELEPDAGIALNLERNADFQLLRVQEELTEKQIDLQKASYLPSVHGFYNYTYKLLKPAFDMSPPHIVGLQMNIPVFSSGERRSRVKQAEIDLETARNNMALMEEQLDIQFKQLQFNLKNSWENYETQKKNVEVSREVYLHLRRKFEQGMISGLELTLADSNYLQAESEYLTSLLEALRSRNALDTLTGSLLNN